MNGRIGKRISCVAETLNMHARHESPHNIRYEVILVRELHLQASANKKGKNWSRKAEKRRIPRWRCKLCYLLKKVNLTC